MNIAYVIVAHQNARQLQRLLGAIDWPGNTYVFHIDTKAPREVHEAARKFADSHVNSAVIPSRRIIWGSWRVAEAQIQCMRRALELSRDWGYCINLSGQDYPLRTQPELAEILGKGPTEKSFVDVLKFAEASENPRKRLEYWWAPWRGRMRKGWRRRRLGFEVFWGSNQWVLSREACEFVVGSELSRRMQRCFHFTLCADELIFQNILMHSPLREKIVAKSMRKVVWEGGSHPKVLTIADKDELLNSEDWFARKFDPTVDSAIMDAIDEDLQRRAARFNVVPSA